MTTLRPDDGLEALPEPLRFVFAPLVKRALGVAAGTLFGGAICLLTLVHCLLGALGITPEAGETEASGHWLWLLSQYFYGYQVSVPGAFIGLFWGFWTGFVMGWFMAGLRNFLVGVWIFWIRARQQLSADRDFLDHI